MFSILFKIRYLHVHVIYMCIIISFGTAQKKKKKKKKKPRFNQIWFFLLCTAIYAFGRLTINICHWHFLLWRYFLRVKCAAISIRLFLYGIFHTVSVIKLYKLCNHFMYPFAHFIANMGFPCRTLIYTPLAGLQSSFCHWRFLFRLYLSQVTAISICSFLYGILYVV